MTNKLKPASELFNEIINHSGSLVIDCDFCGRTYFSNDGQYEEGRLEELRELAKKEPDKYIEGDDYASWGTIDGKQAVIGCECNALGRYEELFWEHREIITEYLTRRAEAEHKETKSDLNNAQQAKDAIEKLD